MSSTLGPILISLVPLFVGLVPLALLIWAVIYLLRLVRESLAYKRLMVACELHDRGVISREALEQIGERVLARWK